MGREMPSGCLGSECQQKMSLGWSPSAEEAVGSRKSCRNPAALYLLNPCLL